MSLQAAHDPSPRPGRFIALLLLLAACIAARSHASVGRPDEPRRCEPGSVDDHVREQFARFVPLSERREYIGIVYLLDGRVASAVVRGRECRGLDRCGAHVGNAAHGIPRRARIVGEWHTHPLKSGSRALSATDVRAAHRQRHVPCYRAYYSTPRDDMYAWDVSHRSVPTAMATRVHLGNLSAPLVPDHRMRLG